MPVLDQPRTVAREELSDIVTYAQGAAKSLELFGVLANQKEHMDLLQDQLLARLATYHPQSHHTTPVPRLKEELAAFSDLYQSVAAREAQLGKASRLLPRIEAKVRILANFLYVAHLSEPAEARYYSSYADNLVRNSSRQLVNQFSC